MRLRDKLKNLPINRIKTDIVPDDQVLQLSLVEVSQKYPVKVRPITHPDFDYEIVNGRQRLDALSKTGVTHVEAIVEVMDDTELHLQALIGNANKPNEIDEAYHIIRLEEAGYTGEQIAKMTRYSQATITQRKKLVEKLHLEGQMKLRTGDLKVSAALEATKLPLEMQQELFTHNGKVSYKEVFEKVREWESEALLFDVEPAQNDIKPGLFLSAEQVEKLLNDQEIEVEYEGLKLNIKRS